MFLKKYLSIEYIFNKITNAKIITFIVGAVFCLIFIILNHNHFTSMTYKEELLEKYMTKTYQEWYVNTAVGITNEVNGISYFKGYFISDPESDIQVDFFNNSEYSKYYWSYKKSEPVYGDFLSGIVNRYFEVLNYTIYMQRGSRYLHFPDDMTMDDIITYLRDIKVDIYITGNIVIDSQDSSLFEFENMCKVLYNDLMEEDIHFDFELRGILVNGTPVEARFQNVKWSSMNTGVTFNYININEEQNTLSDVEVTLDEYDYGVESELQLDEEMQLEILNKLDSNRNVLGPGVKISDEEEK